MKKLILVLSLFLPCVLCAEEANEQTYTQNAFGGLVDEFYADDISATSSPDLSNVYLDEYTNAVVKRRGSVKDNTTAFTGNQWVRNLYDYKKINGDEYRVAQTSGSVLLTIGDGNYTSIIDGLSLTARCDFATAKDYLYGGNGEVVFKSSGTTATLLTVANSTGIPVTAKYMRYINNRMFYAGMPETPSQIWYSEINDPDNVQPLNYILVNVSDGDYLTGIFGYQGKIILTKRYSTWDLRETAVGTFQVSPISFNIGCLYQSTQQTYKDFPIWVSHRGVEVYDGQFNLVSKPINNTMLSLRQLNSSQSVWQQTSASDWGASTDNNVNVDTFTILGSVEISTAAVYYGTTTGNVDEQIYDYTQLASSRQYVRQGFYPTEDCFFYKLYFQVGVTASVGNGGLAIESSLCDVNMNVLDSEVSNYSVSSGVTTQSFQIYVTTIALTKNTTYYAKMSIEAGSGIQLINLKETLTNVSNMLAVQTSRDSSVWSGTTMRLKGSCIGIMKKEASYTSQSHESENWGSWGNFTVDETVPTGSSINYYAVTATSTYNLTTNAAFPLTRGAAISSTVGPFIQIISSFTRTDAAVIPRLNSFIVNYYGTSNVIPCSMVYRDRYYLAVDADNDGENDTVLVYDANGQWTKLSGGWGSACVYRGIPFAGSVSAGQVYQHDVENVYSDDGTAYDSYYCTKMFDFREQDPANSLREKVFLELWTRMNNETSGTLDIDYRLDGSTGDWTNLCDLSLTDPYGLSVKKINFTAYPKSRFVQLRFGNNTTTDKWNLKGFYLPFQVEPRQ